VINLDPDQPLEVLPGAGVGARAAGGAQPIEDIANKVLKMDGGSAEKIAGGEDEGTTSPVPEKVCSSYALLLALFGSVSSLA
jgi:hypothetical protein